MFLSLKHWLLPALSAPGAIRSQDSLGSAFRYSTPGRVPPALGISVHVLRVWLLWWPFALVLPLTRSLGSNMRVGSHGTKCFLRQILPLRGGLCRGFFHHQGMQPNHKTPLVEMVRYCLLLILKDIECPPSLPQRKLRISHPHAYL